MSFSAIDCARARESVSAQLDGELPEFEVDRLATHLMVCADCAAWAEQVQEVTARMREAVLEEPAAGRFVLPRLRRSWRIGSAVALASAAAVVATMFVSPGQQGPTGSQQAAPAGVRLTGHELANGKVLEDGLFIGVSVNSEHVSFQPV